MGHSRDLLERFCLSRTRAYVPQALVIAAPHETDVFARGEPPSGLVETGDATDVSEESPSLLRSVSAKGASMRASAPHDSLSKHCALLFVGFGASPQAISFKPQHRSRLGVERSC